MNTKRLALAASLLALGLQGCSNAPVITTTVTTEAPVIAAAPEPPTIPFQPETLYALLVAEFAGSRERYDIALSNYVQQAHLTRDPGIAGRATRIASFLNANQVALESALLWTQIEPENNEARMIASNQLAQAGRLLEAFDQSAALQNNGGSAIYQTLAARAANATDIQRELLLERFNEQVLKQPEEITLHIGRGLLLQMQSQPEAALQAADQAVELNPDSISASVLQAKLLHQLKQPEKALLKLTTLLDKFPENNRLRLQYARLLASKDLAQAHEQFKILVEKSPNDADLLFSLALLSNERGDIADAKIHFERLLQMGQRTSSSHYYLGRIAEGEQDHETALGHYLAVQPGPDFMSATLRSTDIMMVKGETHRANQQLNDIRARYPSQAERLYLLESELLVKHQYLDAAENLLTDALSQKPGSANLLYARAMVNEKRDYLELTEIDLRSILKYDPNNAMVLNALGYTLADRTDRYQEAYELISQALNVTPDEPSIIDSMGWVQYRMGNYEEALLRLRQAMKVFPDHEVAAHLGEVLWKSGNQEEAREVWNKGLELNPGSDIIPAVIKRLESELAEMPQGSGEESIQPPVEESP